MDDLDVDGRRVLVRVDLDAPVDEAGRVLDDRRLRAALPTLRELLDRGARVVAATQRGEPGGRRDPSLEVEPVAARLAELLDREVRVPDEVVGDGVSKLVAESRPGQLVVLQNLGFEAGERGLDDRFVAALAGLGDVYVGDALGACVRPSASTTGVAARIAERAAGRLLRRELEVLQRVSESPDHPFVLVLGFSEAKPHLDLLARLIERLRPQDGIVLGGAIAHTFLAAQGRALGGTPIDPDALATCRKLLDKASARRVRWLLPCDLRVERSSAPGPVRVVAVETPLEPEDRVVDLGPQSVLQAMDEVRRGSTVFWAGASGEAPGHPLAQSTRTIVDAVAAASGFTVAADDVFLPPDAREVLAGFDHVSTAGSAALALLEGLTLPGVAALKGRKERS